MSIINFTGPVENEKLPVLKRHEFVVINDSDIGFITPPATSKKFLSAFVINFGQIDISATEKLRIFDEASDKTIFEIDLNFDSQSKEVPANLIESFHGTIKAEITVNGQRSNILGPWQVWIDFT